MTFRWTPPPPRVSLIWIKAIFHKPSKLDLVEKSVFQIGIILCQNILQKTFDCRSMCAIQLWFWFLSSVFFFLTKCVNFIANIFLSFVVKKHVWLFVCINLKAKFTTWRQSYNWNFVKSNFVLNSFSFFYFLTHDRFNNHLEEKPGWVY